MSTTVCLTDEQLENFLEQRLPEEWRQIVASHVGECLICQSRLERLTLDDSPWATSNAAPVRPDSAVEARFLDQLKASPPPSTVRVADLLARAVPESVQLSDQYAEAVPSLPGYTIEQLVTKGGMGVVYRANRQRDGGTVAIKMIRASRLVRPDYLKRFRREAELAARVLHPNVVRILEVGGPDEAPFLVMEWLAGGSLADVLTGAPTPPFVAARVARTLAQALRAIHEAGIIHRDIKPANVLLTRSPAWPTMDLAAGVVKITDFGLAKQLGATEMLTHHGAVVGTPHYMAPEQALGHRDRVGPASDIYSLGAVLFEMLTGRPPFVGDDPMVILEKLVREPPPKAAELVPGLPATLDAICEKCLRKEPEDRFLSAAALADELAKIPGELTAHPERRGWLRKMADWWR